MVHGHDGSQNEESAPRERVIEVRGEVIERERLRRLWSIDKLAEVSGVGRRTLNGIPTTGPVTLQLATVEKLIRAFSEHPAPELADQLLGEAAGE